MKLDEENKHSNLIQLLALMLTLICGLSFATGFSLSRLWRLEETIQNIQKD
jgi:hypothetical protein